MIVLASFRKPYLSHRSFREKIRPYTELLRIVLGVVVPFSFASKEFRTLRRTLLESVPGDLAEGKFAENGATLCHPRAGPNEKRESTAP